MTSEDASGITTGQPWVLATLCLSSFVAALSFFATSPFYTRIADDLETTVPLLGQAATLMLVVSAGLGLVVGPYADAQGYRRLMAGGVMAIAAYQLGTAVAPSYPVLLGLSLLGAIGDALVFGLTFALASVLFDGAARQRAISLAVASLSVGAVVGVPVLTFIGDLASWRVALGTFGGATLGLAWMVLAVLPPDLKRPGGRVRPTNLLRAYGPLRRDPGAMRLLAATVTRAVWFLGLATYMGAFLSDELGLSTREVGLFYMLAGAGSVVGSVLAGTRWLAASPRIGVVGSSVVAGTMLWAVISLASTGLTIALLPAMTALGSIASVGIMALLSMESPVPAGTTMALNASLLNVGGAIGAALGGGLLALGGFDALAAGLPLFALVCAVLVRWPSRLQPVADGLA